jgi:hypothetical protein
MLVFAHRTAIRYQDRRGERHEGTLQIRAGFPRRVPSVPHLRFGTSHEATNKLQFKKRVRSSMVRKRFATRRPSATSHREVLKP